MLPILDIITVTKDDLDGFCATIASTRRVRACPGVRQIVIDGSSDEVRKKVEVAALKEENLEYRWKPPQGIADAFNAGIAVSDARWVWFLNGGDEAHPDLDPRFLLQILDASAAAMCIFDLVFTPSGERLSHPPLWRVWPPLYWVPHPATVLRRELFDRHGSFDPEYQIAMDGELWVRLFTRETSVDMLSLPLCLHDQRGISQTQVSRVHREVDKIVARNFRLLFAMWWRRGPYLLQALTRHLLSRLTAGRDCG